MESSISFQSKSLLCRWKKIVMITQFLDEFKFFISPSWDLGKIKRDPNWAGWLTSHINTWYFYRSFLKKVRSHLGEPVHLTGPAHFHMNSPLIFVIVAGIDKSVVTLLKTNHITGIFVMSFCHYLKGTFGTFFKIFRTYLDDCFVILPYLKVSGSKLIKSLFHYIKKNIGWKILSEESPCFVPFIRISYY